MLLNKKCPTHQKTASLVLAEDGLDINACCEEFAKQLQKEYLELESSHSKSK